MEEIITTKALANIEGQALAKLCDKDITNGLRAALKNFIPRCARLRSVLLVAEAEEQVRQAIGD